METYIINLPSAIERLKNISKQLEKLCIPFNVFSAVYGKSLTNVQLKKVYDTEKSYCELGKELTLGEIGCALSHKGVWEKIVRDNVDIALVLEDDAIISDKFKEIYDKLNEEGTKYDYILLSYGIFDKNEIKRYGIHIYNNFFKKGKIIKSFIHYSGMIVFSMVDYFLLFLSKIFGPFIIKKYKPQYSMVGYFITKQGAEKLLKIHDKIFLPSDLLPEKFGKTIDLKFAISIPRLVMWNDNMFDSCIDSQGKREY